LTPQRNLARKIKVALGLAELLSVAVPGREVALVLV
jgi:hypothetical protein